MRSCLRRGFVVALGVVLAWGSAAWSQSPINGTVLLEGGAPSIVHVKRIDYPALQLGTWQEEILVDEDGGFRWNAPDSEGLFELVAPPWSWMVWIRPEETAALHLSAGSSTARRLLGSPGP